MTFLEHLEELRVRLIRCIIALVVGFLVCYGFAQNIFHFITEPLRKAEASLHQAAPESKPATPTPSDPKAATPPDGKATAPPAGNAAKPDPMAKIQFIFTEPAEAFMLFIKMAFFLGIFVVSPFLIYQVWAFIAPGLYPHEKAYAIPFILFGSSFFVLGGAFGHYVLFPMTFRFLITAAGADLQFMPKVSEYFTFYAWFILGLGLIFQLPVVIFVLARIGLVTARQLVGWLKYACLAAFVVSAVITPDGSPVGQTILAVPIIGLYLIGILVAWLFGKARRETPA
jgi:sec-independent protein translocase protein TatC